MAQAPGRIYPNADEFNRTPPPRGSYYNVKEQGLPAPATYRRGRAGRSCCCCFLLWLCSIFTVLVILLGIAVLVFWLVVHPKAPKFDIQDVHIIGLTPSTSPINTNITFELMAQNPNKHMGIYYDEINVDVQANGASIGSGSIPAFYQGDQNERNITGDLSASNLTLSSGTVSVLTSTPSNVPLYAEVDVKARVKVGSIKSSTITVKVRCNLSVNLSETGSTNQLVSKDCKVKW
ncbi:unnamed protein product [Calypogeia fissa]